MRYVESLIPSSAAAKEKTALYESSTNALKHDGIHPSASSTYEIWSPAFTELAVRKMFPISPKRNARKISCQHLFLSSAVLLKFLSDKESSKESR